MNKHMIIFLILVLIPALGLPISVEALAKEICPCSEAVYAFNLKNSQSSVEQYSFSVDKFSKQTKFSENPALVNPGKTKTVYAYITPECDVVGNYDFNFIIKNQGKKTNYPASLKISLCSDFGISFGEYSDIAKKTKFDAHKGPYTLCKGDIKNIPILITNKGNISNNYFFGIDQDFAKLSQQSAALKENQKGIIYLILEPNEIGNNTLFLDVTQERGKIKKTYRLDVEVNECYKLNVDIDKEQDTICSGEETDYSVKITNQGALNSTFNLSTNVDWAGFENGIIEIESGKEADLKLILEPQVNDTGNYDIVVKSAIIDTNVESSDNLKIKITPQGRCYGAKILSNSEYSTDYFGKKIDIKVTNIGLKEADFGVKLEGPSWASINQDKLTLAKGETKGLNIFAKPPKDATLGPYNLTVTLTKGELSYSKNIALELSNQEEVLGKIKLYFNLYIYYVITGIVLLVVVLVLIAIIRQAIKKMPKRLQKPEKEKIKEEVKKETSTKAEKKAKKDMTWIKPFFKALGIMLSVLVVLGGIAYFFNRFKLVDYIQPYIPFIGAGIGLLMIILLIVNNTKNRSKKIKQPKEKKAEKPEKKAKEAKDRSHIVEFIEYLIILLALGGVIYLVFKMVSVKSILMYYLNYAILGFAILVMFIMILNKFRRIRTKKDGKKEIKPAKKIVDKVKKKSSSKPNYFKYLFWGFIIALIGLFILSYTFHQLITSWLSAPYAYTKDFVLLYYQYMIAGFVIMVILILSLKYYKKLYHFLMEEDK